MVPPRKKNPRLKPVPWAITCALAFLPDNLNEQDWLHQVRLIVRTRLPDLKDQMDTPAFIELYDPRISAIIEEELACN